MITWIVSVHCGAEPARRHDFVVMGIPRVTCRPRDAVGFRVFFGEGRRGPRAARSGKCGWSVLVAESSRSYTTT